MSTAEEILIALSKSIEAIRSKVDSCETSTEAVEQTASVLIQMTGESEVGKVVRKIKDLVKQVDAYVKFIESKRHEELLTNIDYLDRAKVVEEYEKLNKNRMSVVSFLNKKAEDILTNDGDLGKFRTEFCSFKDSYKDIYVKEHEKYRSLYMNFCKDFENTTYFKLLEAVENIDKKILEKSTNDIKKEVSAHRRTCEVEKSELQNILRIEPTCRCDYVLIGERKLQSEVSEAEQKTLSQIEKLCALSSVSLLQSLKKRKERFQKLMEEERIREGLDLLQVLERASISKSSEDLNQALRLLLKLKDILKKIHEAPTPVQPTSPPSISLSKLLVELKQTFGEKATIRDFLELLEKYDKDTVITA